MNAVFTPVPTSNRGVARSMPPLLGEEENTKRIRREEKKTSRRHTTTDLTGPFYPNAGGTHQMTNGEFQAIRAQSLKPNKTQRADSEATVRRQVSCIYEPHLQIIHVMHA